MLTLHIGVETRLLIDAKQAGDATADSASGAADDRANWASGMIAIHARLRRRRRRRPGRSRRKAGQVIQPQSRRIF